MKHDITTPIPDLPTYGQLAKFCAGMLGKTIENSPIVTCGICEHKKFLMEEQYLVKKEDKVHFPRKTKICWDCGAPQFEFPVKDSLRNAECLCGSEKKYKDCCMDLCKRSNSVTSLAPTSPPNSASPPDDSSQDSDQATDPV